MSQPNVLLPPREGGVRFVELQKGLNSSPESLTEVIDEGHSSGKQPAGVISYHLQLVDSDKIRATFYLTGEVNASASDIVELPGELTDVEWRTKTTLGDALGKEGSQKAVGEMLSQGF
eukprot:Hpha_TRINITY_DN9569_c0_g1::TRINITY_DN9569_c0_g1_i1::g.114969::m.114969